MPTAPTRRMQAARAPQRTSARRNPALRPFRSPRESAAGRIFPSFAASSSRIRASTADFSPGGGDGYALRRSETSASVSFSESSVPSGIGGDPGPVGSKRSLSFIWFRRLRGRASFRIILQKRDEMSRKTENLRLSCIRRRRFTKSSRFPELFLNLRVRGSGGT